MSVLHVVLPPLVTTYAIFVAMVLVARRRPVPRPRGWGRPPIRQILTTVAGGYLAFLAIVVVFHTWIAGQPTALWSAVRGGGFLAAVFLVVGAIGSRVRGGPNRGPTPHD